MQHQVTIKELIHLALGPTPNVKGTVNFNILRTALLQLVKTLELEEKLADLDEGQQNQIENYINYINTTITHSANGNGSISPGKPSKCQDKPMVKPEMKKQEAPKLAENVTENVGKITLSDKSNPVKNQNQDTLNSPIMMMVTEHEFPLQKKPGNAMSPGALRSSPGLSLQNRLTPKKQISKFTTQTLYPSNNRQPTKYTPRSKKPIINEKMREGKVQKETVIVADHTINTIYLSKPELPPPKESNGNFWPLTKPFPFQAKQEVSKERKLQRMKMVRQNPGKSQEGSQDARDIIKMLRTPQDDRKDGTLQVMSFPNKVLAPPDCPRKPSTCGAVPANSGTDYVNDRTRKDEIGASAYQVIEQLHGCTQLFFLHKSDSNVVNVC